MQVHLQASQRLRLPLSQNYFLASAIYDVLGARPDYARFLRDRGYIHEASGRAFKLFVFGPLQCGSRRVVGAELLLGPGPVSWTISSPIPEFLTALAEGLLARGEIQIQHATLPIEKVEAEAEPSFTSRMCFTCLSPIVIARPSDSGGYAHFCTHEDPDFAPRVRANLLRKHELIHGASPDDTEFDLRFDPGYIARRGGRITKLLDIRGTQVRGVLAPFIASGSAALLRVGYECGLGERNSMGFGCVRIADEQPLAK